MRINYATRYRQLDRPLDCQGFIAPDLKFNEIIETEPLWLNLLECDCNTKGLIFDEANEAMEEIGEQYDPKEWDILKFHVNTWGLSSNELFADTVVTKMNKLQKLDLSDTVQFDHRTDMPQSIGKFLSVLKLRNNFTHLDLSNNDLKKLGGIEALAVFFEKNTSLKILNLQNCNIEDPTWLRLEEGVAKNPNLAIEQLNISGCHLSKEVKNAFMTFVLSMKKLWKLDISNTCHDHSGEEEHHDESSEAEIDHHDEFGDEK